MGLGGGMISANREMSECDTWENLQEYGFLWVEDLGKPLHLLQSMMRITAIIHSEPWDLGLKYA